eukprot:TRINITY_DN8854_c0_g1_i1.p1 TRINITY_DN8854_c0_g1~~TRINITY_DN8854_c0_g1_i1.p1  ORF type:complete len:446 (+),score=82.40 TRINITY_DN8854_c0_g1_i1:102-1439(+)
MAYAAHPPDSPSAKATGHLRKNMTRARSENILAMHSMQPSEELLRKLPKADLHVHLDGSLRLSTLIELAKAQGVELPSYEEAELLKTVFKPQYKDLPDYLQGFAYTCAVMRDAASVERISYEFAVDNYTEGVRYFEVRYAPQLHASADSSFSICDVNRAVDSGLRRARDEFNHKLESADADEPLYEYGIIVCAMRMIFPGMSRYYDALLAIHSHDPPEKVRSMASLALVNASIQNREEGVPIVALDIAGAEDGFPASEHTEAFDLAQKNYISKTVHAGEGYGPESINQAVRDLHADRIGHGFHLFSGHMITSEKTLGKDKGEAFMGNLLKWVSDRRICFEVCLTSNLQTMPGLKLEDHAFQKMVNSGVAVALCTDNRLVSRTSCTEELQKAIETFQMKPKQVRDVIISGFKRSFYPGPYEERRAYVRKVTDYYDRMIAKYYQPEN